MNGATQDHPEWTLGPPIGIRAICAELVMQRC
jgi:hypothetical protein